MSIPGVIVMSFLTALVIFIALAIFAAAFNLHRLKDVAVNLFLAIIFLGAVVMVIGALTAAWMQALGYA